MNEKLDGIASLFSAGVFAFLRFKGCKTRSESELVIVKFLRKIQKKA